MTTINLGRDLAKLPITERLNIMMHYRAAAYLQKPTPISELEYNALDASIKSSDEVRAYNKAHGAYMELSYQFDFIIKQVLRVQLCAHYFKILWFITHQTNNYLEALDYLNFRIKDELSLTQAQQDRFKILTIESLNNSFILFHDFDEASDSEQSINAKFRQPKSFKEKEDELNQVIERVKSEIEEYKQMEQKLGLVLTSFTSSFENLISEAESHKKCLNILQNAA